MSTPLWSEAPVYGPSMSTPLWSDPPSSWREPKLSKKKKFKANYGMIEKSCLSKKSKKEKKKICKEVEMGIKSKRSDPLPMGIVTYKKVKEKSKLN